MLDQTQNDLLTSLIKLQQELFRSKHPRSAALFAEGQESYLYGAPSHWMRRWAGGFPLFVADARGATVTDVDGNNFVDFALGDTGAMCGHANPIITDAVANQLAHGATTMMPTEDAIWVGRELRRRFGLQYWGLTTSATDANRAAIRISRMVTDREKVLIFSGCYHGNVDEAHVTLHDGKVGLRSNIHANAVDHARISKVVEFNDVQALRAALKDRDVACVLTEPSMTNFGMIAPEPGFHEALRSATRETGTLLIIDETHTISSGEGGYTGLHGLEPDIFVLGKAIGGGVPVAVFGVTAGVAERLWSKVPRVNPLIKQSAHFGIGGTLAGSALGIAAIRAVLEKVLTEEAFNTMLLRATEMAKNAREILLAARIPWTVVQLGARLEYIFASAAPRNAAEAGATRNDLLELLLHVFFLNRGVVVTPFHNMFLTCPATTTADVARHNDVLRDFAEYLNQQNIQWKATA